MNLHESVGHFSPFFKVLFYYLKKNQVIIFKKILMEQQCSYFKLIFIFIFIIMKKISKTTWARPNGHP